MLTMQQVENYHYSWNLFVIELFKFDILNLSLIFSVPEKKKYFFLFPT